MLFSLHSDKFLIHAEANIHPVSRMTKLAPGGGGGGGCGGEGFAPVAGPDKDRAEARI